MASIGPFIGILDPDWEGRGRGLGGGVSLGVVCEGSRVHHLASPPPLCVCGLRCGGPEAQMLL